MRKTVFFTTMPALLLIISLIAVSCAPANLQDSDSDTIYVYFGNLEAKAVDETAYTSEGKVENGTSSVTIGDVDDYYWAYSAVKADNLFTEGATYQKGGTQTFADCADDKGLGSARPFSKGAWTFELRAYASAADRTAGTQYLFSGKTTTESLTTATSVAIPVTYSYIAGKGTASFTISTEVKQDTLSGYDTYKITGVNAIIDGTTKVALSDSDNDGAWTGTKTELASGVKTIGLEVFVDSESTARTSTDKLTSAIILHGMTTEISGKATVTLTGATMQIDFNGTSLPTEQPTKDGFPVFIKAPSTVKTGDILEIGTYPATYTNNSDESVSAGDYAGKSVTWLVLEVDTTNNKALVISENVLTNMKHMIYISTYTWSNSLIRTWLNNTGTDGFISQYGLNNVSFVSVTHDTDLYESTESTTDKVFLLSASDAENYFADTTARTAYQFNGGTSGINWGLRSHGSIASALVSSVTYDGYVNSLGVAANYTNGVRPAFWIEIEKIDYSAYSVGSTGPAGGLIFYDAGDVKTSYYMDGDVQKSYSWRFLEASPNNLNDGNWVIFGLYRTTPTGDNLVITEADTSVDDAGNSAIGQGRMNTSKLVKAMGIAAYASSDTSVTSTNAKYAAKLCDDYYISNNGITYYDWFLPSAQELQLMYTNLKAQGLGEWVDVGTQSTYWSSSEYSDWIAHCFNFYKGETKVNIRNGIGYLRAARAF